MPQVALELWLQTFLDLAHRQPARRVLSNVLWFRLARCHLQSGTFLQFTISWFSRTNVGKQHLRPAL